MECLSPHNDPRLCNKAGTCEWRDCDLRREGGSCSAWLWHELMCVLESVYLCVNANPMVES